MEIMAVVTLLPFSVLARLIIGQCARGCFRVCVRGWVTNRRVGVQAWRFEDPSRPGPSRRWVTADGRMGSPPSNSIHHMRARAPHVHLREHIGL